MQKATFLGAVLLSLFMGFANFSWQFFQDEPNIMQAIERTYFQAWAILLAWGFWRESGKE